MKTNPLEAHTRSQINLRLQNYGWEFDQKNPQCNVFQEQAKTQKQKELLQGGRPDYVLYETGSDIPLAIIEAKKPGGSLDEAILQAEKYAVAINAPIVFAFNDTFVIAKHISQNRPLKIDGEELQEFVDEETILRFIHEGAEILSTPKGVSFSRDDLLDIFKKINNQLRKDGLREGFERFSAFAEILFLKLVDESEKLNEHSGRNRTIEKRYCWSDFTVEYKDQRLLDFVRDSVWKRMKDQYGDIFDPQLKISNPSTLQEIVDLINPINFTATDTDVKGDAFEYFLKSVTNGNKDLGEYFTPRHIVRTMVNLVKPHYGEKIYDPFCGTGGFLLEAFKYLSVRVDANNSEFVRVIKQESLYGREITSTARIAKMNMILFGDGHTNVEQVDTLSKPVSALYDVVLANIPYSQKTEFGSFYPIPSRNADAVCLQHIWESLKPNGRAAVIVPESVLYEDGDVGKTRELIARQSAEFSVISLPRGVFMPYTPTKTNILYFKKGGQFKKSYHFVVLNDGFELNTKRKSIAGSSDLKKLLSVYDDKELINSQANLVSREEIESSGNWNMRPFYYMNDVPKSSQELVYLDESVIKEVKTKVDPRKSPKKEYNLLQVSQNGIFLDETILGEKATQAYKKVQAGDIVYNPYRVNIGSIGVVPSHLDNALVSPAYVVVRVHNKDYTPSYIVAILKTERYMRVIMNYSLGSARASLPFSELNRIQIPNPSSQITNELISLDNDLQKKLQEVYDIQKKIIEQANSYLA
ncbi:MAG: N-6 DNA methylase [bacterium]|nr:N-6 DNA methylase [bacterium]